MDWATLGLASDDIRAKSLGQRAYTMTMVATLRPSYLFILKALAKIGQLAPSRKTWNALEKGVNYYLKNLVDAEGLSRAVFCTTAHDRISERARDHAGDKPGRVLVGPL